MLAADAASIAKWTLRILLLYVLFLVCFSSGSMAVAGALPEGATSQPGLVSPTGGLLIIALANVALVTALILASRWRGWKLATALSLAYYGAVTLLTQIETWHFLSSLTVSPRLLPGLFLMGVPPAFLFVPLAVWILGRGRAGDDAPPSSALRMPALQWILKLAVLVVVYVALYWAAGYYIAWQNPELRAFYGQPGEPLPFLAHVASSVRDDPVLLPLQALRALLWVACALPIIRGSRVGPWATALLVGLLFSVPQNLSHILANPLMPLASVRLSHMAETAPSTFVFGAAVVWLLHREHPRLGDLLGRKGTGGGRGTEGSGTAQGG